MDLDDLKLEWNQVRDRVERLEHTRSRGALRALRLGLWTGQLVWVALVVASARFWAAHLDALHLVAAGISLHLYGIAAIVLGALQLRALRAIDYREPVVTLQRRLAKLTRLRARSSLALGLPWWFLWVPSLICVSGGAFYDPWWAAGSLAVGALGLAVTIAIARRTTLLDGLAGRTLLRATREVETVETFSDRD